MRRKTNDIVRQTVGKDEGLAERKMFCPKCGKDVPGTAMFCGNCGYKFEKSKNRKWIGAKTKKLEIALLGCCACLVILVCFSLFHKTPDWRYRIDDGKATITGYTGKESEIIIPETVKRGWKAYYVTKIDDFAFSECSSLTSVMIQDGVVEIGDRAFAECSSLTSIKIPDSVTETNIGLPDSETETNIGLPDSETETNIELPDSETETNIETPGRVIKGSEIRITDSPF